MLFKSHLLLKCRYRPEIYNGILAGKINKPDFFNKPQANLLCLKSDFSPA